MWKMTFNKQFCFYLNKDNIWNYYIIRNGEIMKIIKSASLDTLDAISIDVESTLLKAYQHLQ